MRRFTYWPEDRFLVRWWVNGKPFVPRRARPARREGDTEFVFDSRPVEDFGQKRLRLDMRFPPEALGAKKGDRIGVQFLHCGNGWTVLWPDLLSGLGDSNRPFPRLSNRVEFRCR